MTFCFFSGRLDQIFANIDTLFHAEKLLKKSLEKVLLISSTTLSWILEKGKHKIFTGKKEIKPKVGLIPVGKPIAGRVNRFIALD